MASIWLLLHLVGVVLWVGGMGFGVMVLRPSLAALEPPARLWLMGQVHGKFFRMVWVLMPLVILSGYMLLFGVYGGFGWSHRNAASCQIEFGAWSLNGFATRRGASSDAAWRAASLRSLQALCCNLRFVQRPASSSAARSGDAHRAVTPLPATPSSLALRAKHRILRALSSEIAMRRCMSTVLTPFGYSRTMLDARCISNSVSGCII